MPTTKNVLFLMCIRSCTGEFGSVMGGSSLLCRLVSVFGLTFLCHGRYNGSRTEILHRHIKNKNSSKSSSTFGTFLRQVWWLVFVVAFLGRGRGWHLVLIIAAVQTWSMNVSVCLCCRMVMGW